MVQTISSFWFCFFPSGGSHFWDQIWFQGFWFCVNFVMIAEKLGTIFGSIFGTTFKKKRNHFWFHFWFHFWLPASCCGLLICKATVFFLCKMALQSRTISNVVVVQGIVAAGQSRPQAAEQHSRTQEQLPFSSPYRGLAEQAQL